MASKKAQRHIIASIGTTLFMLLVLLILLFVFLSSEEPKMEEGIELAFGDVEDAGGFMAEQSEAVPLPAPEPAAPQYASSPSDNEYLTTEDEEAIALRKAAEEAEKARKQAEAAERAKQAEAIAKANQMGSLFGKSGNTTGSGDGQGGGQKGNPIGHGSSGGNDWSLAGRNIKGSLPRPANTFNQEGQVIVEIRVNAAGKVVSATLKGGNISDKQTQQLALEAARKAQFTEDDHDQIGTITYNFKFN